MEFQKTEQIKRLVEEFLMAAGLDGRVAAMTESAETLSIQLESNEAGYLIGRDGDTLRALQLLVRLMASKKLAEPVRLSLDVNNYQDEKLKALIAAAQNLAREVVRSGSWRALPPMNAYERRQVHTALAEMTGIKTESEGEGENRRVVIRPINA